MPDADKKVLSGPLQIELKNELKAPASFANAMALNTINESLVFTFGYFDPTALKRETDGSLKATAPVFAQIAVPRTSFAPWLVQAMTLIRDMPDRDTFGWAEVVKLISESTRGT